MYVICILYVCTYIYIYTYTHILGLGGNQTCLEEDVRQQVGSFDPIPISVYRTLTLSTYKRLSWTLPGVPTRRCMCSSVHAWLHRASGSYDLIKW